MMRESFYLTLMSNSSFDFYPENKTSNFKVHLGKEIALEGELREWKVCLSDLIYPNTFFNVSEGSNTIKVTQIADINAVESHGEIVLKRRIGIKEVEIAIPIGHYFSVEEIIASINKSFFDQFACNLFSKNLTNNRRVEIDVDEDLVRKGFVSSPYIQNNYDNLRVDAHMNEIKVHLIDAHMNEIKIHLNGRLSTQLGFQPNENILRLKTSSGQANVDAGIASEMLLYVDVIEPQIISDSFTQLLKIVKTIEKGMVYGEILTREFYNRCYLSVNKKRFQEICIEIRDVTGKLLPFELGTSIVTLHFQRI